MYYEPNDRYGNEYLLLNINCLKWITNKVPRPHKLMFVIVRDYSNYS